jgi:glycosyltransferase involved in cell wall biosynthesis
MTPHNITVIISTYNRALTLGKTLATLVDAQRRFPSARLVVVDNGSTDQTASVVKSFQEQHNLSYLFEGRSGKNRALNRALDTYPLGELVVFTDDDVEVPAGWLTSIQQVADRWPDYAVFGGRVDAAFDEGYRAPSWAANQYVAALAFGQHSYSERECVYKGSATPFGGNFWVRSSVFRHGRRFDERVGPRQRNRVGGGETSFLYALRTQGFRIVYSPEVVVRHRVEPGVLKLRNVCWRAYRWGRARPYVYGLPQQELLEDHPGQWCIERCLAISCAGLRAVSLIPSLAHADEVGHFVKRFENIGLNVEALRIAGRGSGT